MKTYKGVIVKLADNQIAVVGTNPQGRHGAGAAKWAHHNAGLKYGHSMGLCGQSYGIITKDLRKDRHPSVERDRIENQILHLYGKAMTRPKLEFLVFYDGIGPYLCGYTPQEMAEMFSAYPIPGNVVFEEEFAKLLK